MGTVDLPAMFDFVLKYTDQEKLTYVGHSQGNTQMFVALAENAGRVRNQVNFFIAMAPVVYPGGSNMFMKFAVKYGIKLTGMFNSVEEATQEVFGTQRHFNDLNEL